MWADVVLFFSASSDEEAAGEGQQEDEETRELQIVEPDATVKTRFIFEISLDCRFSIDQPICQNQVNMQ